MDPGPVWSRRIADELWSGVVTPLTFSLLAEPMAEHMARRRLESAGLTELASRPVFRLVRGHVYVNASLVAEVMGEIPAMLVSEGLLELLPEELRDDVRGKGRWLLSARTVSIVLHLTLQERAWMPWSRAALFRDAASRVAPDLEQLVPSPDACDEALATAIADVQKRLGSYLEVVSWGMIYAYVFFHLASELLERWLPVDSAPTTMADLTLGLDDVVTFAIHEELVRCAALARDDAALRDAMARDPGEVAARACAGELGVFGDRLRELVARHGHRLAGRDLSYPTWRERPGVVVEMVRKLLEAGPLEPAARRAERRDRLLGRVAAQLASGLGGTARRLAFERCLTWCREYYALRENMRYHADLFLAALRGLALRASDRLVAAGILGARDDVFYLEGDELTGVLRGVLPAAEVAARAATRRAAYERDAGATLPETLYGDAEADEPVHEPARRHALRGLGVSPGRAVGRARVVHSVEDLQALRAGEVIVAASTDPSWTSLLALGSALVLEMGGLLSHGAIVARELGIPAVVNVAQATRLLANGDQVVVDGRAGTVVLA